MVVLPPLLPALEMIHKTSHESYKSRDMMQEKRKVLLFE